LALLNRRGGIDYVLGRVKRHTDTVAGALQQEADRVSIAERNTSSCAASADLIALGVCLPPTGRALDIGEQNAVADHLRTHAGLRCPVLRTEPFARAGHVAFNKEVSTSEALVEDDSACVVDAIGCGN
jgi:hypothetical protein